MDHRAQLENKKYRNWVRAGLGFKYVKDGLEPFCDHLVNQQHVDIIDKVKQKHNLSAVACRLCDVRTLQPDHVQAKNRLCPLGQTHCNCLHPRGKTSCNNNVCGAIYDEIIRRHASTPPAPYWRNTDAQQWCTEPWAVAKCFLNAPGYEHKLRATEFDCSGLLHLLINNIEFHHHIQCKIDGNDAFSRVLQHRNAIFHCNNMEVEDTDIANYIDDMIEQLQDDKEMKDRQESKNAVKKLLELKQEKFVITTTDEMEVRRIAMDAIEEKEKDLEQRIVDAATEIGVKTDEGEKQIKVIGSTIKDELAEKRVEMKDDLRKTEIDSIGRLEKKRKEIKEVLMMKEIESAKKIDQKVRESKENLRMTEINSKQGLKHEEIEIKKSLRVVELESKGRLDQKGKEIEKHLQRKGEDILYQLERKQSAQIQIEARHSGNISKAAADDLMQSSPRDTPLQSNYERMRADLREDLIGLYREEYHTLPLSPLLEENDTPLLEFYVIPDINSVEIQRSREGGKEVRSKVTSLHDVFYKKNEPCRKIYLTSDAGFGKTALSKRLILTWCQAKQRIQIEEKYFEKEAINAMSNFEFVFLLSLRDCSEECDIDEMIIKQIITQLAHASITMSDLETILSKENCLVILDGLDEWCHPEPIVCKQGKSDIPHRKARRCTILTTTRPWKLGVSKIRLSEIKRKLELVGLSKTSARSLKRSVISLLWGETDIEKHIQEFDLAISDRGISDLETIPLLLVYLLCLWCDETDLGKSRTELYFQIANLLLKRTFEKYPDMQQSCEQPKSDIPQCISRNEQCRKHYNLLNALGKLAFETLFDETKEQNLVFDMAVAEKCLSDKDFLQLSRLSGIITHDKDQTKINKQMQKTSFSHATVQDFFAALYISVSWDQEEVRTKVLSFCHCVARILAMSKVFVLISGINATIFSSLSKDLTKVISEDKITREYRSTADWKCKPLKDIQDMYISCMKENTSDKELKLFCQDFFFSEDCKEEKYFTYLARLVVHNKNNMASINIDTEDSGRSLREIIDSCALHELSQINKIFYHGKEENAQLPVLLDKSSKCVTVRSPGPRGSWSREMLETLQNNSLLEAIHIWNFKMSHDVLNDFLNYIINRKTMTEIRLRFLVCTEHKRRSCTFSLDFSQHSDLRQLELYWIPKVSQLKVNSQVKHVTLTGIYLGEMSLPPEMANIESVDLWGVNMSASTLRDLVKVVEKLSHKVTVTIGVCNIEPETEFEHVKQYIHSSQNFRVTVDFWKFVFETKVES